jgi:hypothetical protein
MKPAMRTLGRISGLAVALLTLASCMATQVTSVTKDPSFQTRDMHHILVIAIMRRPANQQLLEDEFVRRITRKGADAVSAHTIVKEGEPQDEAAWKQMILNNHFDTVLVTRLKHMDVEQKEEEKSSGPKFLQTPSTGYGYYGYRYVYQPGYTSVPEQTAMVETRIFRVAEDKMVWSAQSKTDIEWGRDPEAQIRDFVDLMMKKIAAN